MKAEELIDGIVYAAISTSDAVYFFRCKHPNKSISYLNNNNYHPYNNGNLDTRTNSAFRKEYRECTEDERIVFDASEKAKKYVPLEVAKRNLAPKIVDNYTLI